MRIGHIVIVVSYPRSFLLLGHPRLVVHLQFKTKNDRCIKITKGIRLNLSQKGRSCQFLCGINIERLKRNCSNKKVLLRYRKRRTGRGVTNQTLVMSGGGGNTLSHLTMGYPTPVTGLASSSLVMAHSHTRRPLPETGPCPRKVYSSQLGTGICPCFGPVWTFCIVQL